MEEMLGQKMRPPIALRKFLSDYREALREECAFPSSEVDIKQVMQLTHDAGRFEAIETSCSLEKLQQPDDARISKFIPGFTELNRKAITHVPVEAMKLKTFSMLLKSKELSTRNPFKRSQEIFKMVKAPEKGPEEEHTAASFKMGDELKMYVRIYRQARATHIGRSLEKPVFAQEFECLGSNLLTELRDKISCVCNNKRFFDISDDPNAPLPKEETDPGYFFITDTFYNDKRNPANADYSEIIRNWAKSAKGLSSLDFKVALMEETRFLDLTVSLGFPQLYQHHGNCEHVFTFSQVEVVTSPSTQLLSRDLYPRLRSFGLYNNRLCNLCGTLHYVYIVEESNRQLHDPAYLCKKCFFAFHYIDGKKIGSFRAYRVNDGDELEEGETDLAEEAGGPPNVGEDQKRTSTTTNDIDNEDS